MTTRLREHEGGRVRLRARLRAVVAWLVVSLPLLLLNVADIRLPRLLQAASAKTPTGCSKPNVVVFMTDDMRESDMAYLPRVRELLGNHGTTFSNSFAASPQCAPSRATLLTGQLPHNNGIRGNSDASTMTFTNTLPVWMQAAGYYTSHTGKLLLDDQPRNVPPGFDDYFGLAPPHGYSYFDFTVNDDGTLRTFTGPENYQSDVLAEHAVEIINARATAPEPLFMTVAPITPHDEVNATIQQDPTTENVRGGDDPDPAPRYAGTFANEPLPMPPNFNEADVSDKPREVSSRSLLTSADIEAITKKNRARLESLQALNDNVEAIYNALAATGQLANTIFVFTSDNGWMLGEHRYAGGKTVNYEESVRVPLLVRGPGFPAGVVRTQPVVNVDLTATFAEVACATPGRPLDGTSLLPVAASKSFGRDRVVPLEIRFTNATGGGPLSPLAGLVTAGHFANPSHYNATRTLSWKYVRHTDTGEEELYSYETDPFELVNLAGDPAYATTKAALAAEENALATCSGASCVRYASVPRR